MTLTDEQRELLEDKFVLWDRASREGNMELRDYNRRAAEALKVALSIVSAALSPPSTGGEGEALIMRVGERIADEVEKVAGGRQSNCEQAARDIVGWLHPSPEMGEISRERLRLTDAYAALRSIAEGNLGDEPWQANYETIRQVAINALPKLKENGLSREELGGLARSLPSGDAQERSPVPPLSDGGAS